MSLLPGKIPAEILERTVFKYLGAARKDIIFGPSKGEDAAIVSDGCKLLAIHGDPISGANERIGWIAMNIATNDIATRGVRPFWAVSCIMLPVGSTKETIEMICRDMSTAAENLGVGIIGGHSEITPGLDHPLVIVFCIGVVENEEYVTCRNARPGSTIILTKSIGIEGTAILATDREEAIASQLGTELVRKAKEYINELSVFQEAMIAFHYGGVQAMHDPTEGGIANGLHELADASNTGFKIYERDIHISPETRAICQLFDLDPFNLISSGSLLIVADKEKAEGIVDQLINKGIDASIIGKVLANSDQRLLVRETDDIEPLERPQTDELWSALAKKL